MKLRAHHAEGVNVNQTLAQVYCQNTQTVVTPCTRITVHFSRSLSSEATTHPHCIQLLFFVDPRRNIFPSASCPCPSSSPRLSVCPRFLLSFRAKSHASLRSWKRALSRVLGRLVTLEHVSCAHSSSTQHSVQTLIQPPSWMRER